MMRTSACVLTAERDAVRSSCCGFLGEAVLTDSAVIILFAGMLGAGDMFSLLTTSMLPFFNGMFVIPMAWVAMRAGVRRLNLVSNVFAAGAYFVAVSAPLWGRAAMPVLITGIILFAFSLTGFIASWFPLLDGFLQSARRAAFFGRMRFSHQATAVVFLFLVGLVIGDDPPLWKLQLVLLAGGVIFCGRAFFVSRLPAAHGGRDRGTGFRRGLAGVLRNRSLMGFSTYLFMLNLASFGTIPLILLTLKRQWNAPDNVIVIISSVAMAGMLLGYVSANRIIRRFGVRGVIVGIHAVFMLVNPVLAFIDGSGLSGFVMLGALAALNGTMAALASIVASSEMMALASEGNKTLSMAVCSALSFGGAGGARLAGSFFLGSGLLAERWYLWGHAMSRYQALFLVYALLVVVAAVFLPLVPAVVSVARTGAPAAPPPVRSGRTRDYTTARDGYAVS